MHALFEAQQVLDHVQGSDGLEMAHADALAAVRVGLVLTGLAAAPAAPRASVRAAWQRLTQANDDGLLQVFLDGEGMCRGYAILALLNDADDARARANPRLLGDAKSHKNGSHAWLLALSGGLGQGWAIARHLRDNFLQAHDRLTYLRRTNGKLMLKTMERSARAGFARRSQAQPPAGGTRFTQFRLARPRVVRFYHYARLLSAAAVDDPKLAAAMEDFGSSDALQQFRFDQDEQPNAFISWAMLGDEAMRRLEAEKTGRLRPGDWRSGTMPCVIDALGDEQEVKRSLTDWRSEFPSMSPIRLIVDRSAREVRFADAG